MFSSSTVFRIPKACLFHCMCIRSQDEMVLTNWRSPGEVPADLCPQSVHALERTDGEAVYHASREAEEVVKPIIELGGFGARKLERWQKVWGRGVWILFCWSLALTLAPSKSKWQMCVLMDESALCQFSCPPGQHPHLSTPPPLLSLFLVQVFLYIRFNVQPCSLTDSHFSHPCSYPHSKGPAKPYYSFPSVPIWSILQLLHINVT